MQPKPAPSIVDEPPRIVSVPLEIIQPSSAPPTTQGRTLGTSKNATSQDATAPPKRSVADRTPLPEPVAPAQETAASNTTADESARQTTNDQPALETPDNEQARAAVISTEQTATEPLKTVRDNSVQETPGKTTLGRPARRKVPEPLNRVRTSIAIETIIQLDAAFDSSILFETAAGRVNDPVGNSLTTGGPPRLIEDTFDARGGVRRSTRHGTTFDRSQAIGLKDSNSNLF